MGIVDPTIVHQIKKLREEQAAQHEALMQAIDTNNEWLAHLAAILERQAPMQPGVFHQQSGAR